jgi:hypothetical protein
MDITRLPFEKQVSPQPWIAIRRQRSLDDLIGQALEENPDATANEVAKKIASWGYDVSGILIARKMQALSLPRRTTTGA